MHPGELTRIRGILAQLNIDFNTEGSKSGSKGADSHVREARKVFDNAQVTP